jgi:mRNA interferase MazF
VRRGEVWTLAGGKDYASKPRPAVIVQDDRYDATESITVVGLTSTAVDAPVSRPVVHPTEMNGLRVSSHFMVDKITTVPKKRLGRRLGTLSNDDVVRLDRAIVVFLGLATPRSRSSEVLPAS